MLPKFLQDKNLTTPLHEACRYGFEDIVTVLTGRGASMIAQDNEGNTPLHIASRWGHADIVEQLLEKGADETITNTAGLIYSDLVNFFLIS